MKMKKGTLEKFDQLTDTDKKMKKRHITEKMKDKRDMKLPFEETKHTKINEMMKTVKDRDVGRTNKRNEIDDNHSDELKHDEKRKRKRVKQVKEHKKDSRVKDKKKSSELQENKDHLEEEEEDEVQNTKEDRKAVQLSKFTQPMKDKISLDTL
ncbi:unnamed protein product [Heterobilharzia americana]|nr:unnamed protein product [Heterobilharzia americana]